MNSLFDSGEYYVCGAVQNSRKIKVACEQALGEEEGRGGKKESKLSGKRRGGEGRRRASSRGRGGAGRGEFARRLLFRRY